MALFNVAPIMRVAVLQLSPHFGKVEQNMSRATELITSIKADLFVLPELCFTGYTFRSYDEALSLAESAMDGMLISGMSRLAARTEAGIVFGFPERVDNGIYNSCAFLAPDGGKHIYRKLHLFMHEKDWFLPGDRKPAAVNHHGCRLGLMICFDWIFPETVRCLALLGSHIICHPANLVLPYCQAAMVTRSLENRVFSLTANRVGRETRGGYDFKFTGRSQIISPRGEVLFRASDDKEELGVADIDFRESENKSVNEKNNIWADRRPEFYSEITNGENRQ
jgi:predicted amidohydrolase